MYHTSEAPFFCSRCFVSGGNLHPLELSREVPRKIWKFFRGLPLRKWTSLHPWSLTARPRKMVVGKLLPYWEGQFFRGDVKLRGGKNYYFPILGLFSKLLTKRVMEWSQKKGATWKVVNAWAFDSVHIRWFLGYHCVWFIHSGAGVGSSIARWSWI